MISGPKRSRNCFQVYVIFTLSIFVKPDGLQEKMVQIFFVEVYLAVVATLEEIRCNTEGSWNKESTQKENSLYHSIINFQFSVTLVIVSRCLEVTRPLTKQRQSSSLDAGSTTTHILFLCHMLERMCSNVEKRHENWFNEAVGLAESVGTSPEKPRTAGRQKNRENVPADSVSQYYCRCLLIPFFEHLLSQIQTRFLNSSLDILDALYGMPKHVVATDNWKPKFSKFLEIYEDDLPEPRHKWLKVRLFP